MVADDLFSRLADALDRLPGRFPRTASGAEIPLLRCLFTPEQAELGAVMDRDYEPAVEIALRTGLPTDEVARRLEAMDADGLVLGRGSEAARRYRLNQFLDGIVELQLSAFGAELAHLFEAYMSAGGAKLLMGDPAYARVVPVDGSIRSEWVLPYDDVRAILEQTPHILLTACMCRVERTLAGSGCTSPVDVCLNLFREEPPAGEGEVISTDRALQILKDCEDAGLVHTVSNVQGGWDWLCNCCSCCCEWLRGYGEWGIESALVRNYRAVVDVTSCSGCALCAERCQVKAIEASGAPAVVEAGLCIGCGLCVTSCPEDAMKLERLPEPDLTLPPRDREAWEAARLRGTE
jgi:electron transport complex protein RnfB